MSQTKLLISSQQFFNKLIYFFFFCLCTTWLIGCSDANDADNSTTDKKTEKHLRIVSIYAPATFDPHLEPNWFMINSGSVETLVRVDEKLNLQPWLAESWESSDGQTWVLHIRNNMKFQNGKPVTAKAVKASLERAIAKNKAIKTALRVKSMEAEGQTLTVITKDVHPTFISELVHPNAVILDVTEPDIETKPIGTGPYKVASVQSMVGAELVRNPYYWDGEVPLDRITFKGNTDANARMLALQSGDMDILYRPSVESIEVLQKTNGITVDSVEGARVYYLLHNYQGPNAKWMNNKEFRKGMDALINRDELVKTVFHQQGVVSLGPFPAGAPYAANYEVKPFGIDIALQHFAKAGLTVTDGKVSDQGKPIQLHLAVYTARAEFPIIAQIYQDTAKKLGIDIKIQVVERIEEYLPNAQWDLATYALVTVPRGDASYFFNAACYPNRFLNFGHMDIPEFNQLVDKLNMTVDAEQRIVLAKQLTEMIDEETYHAFYMVNPKVTTAFRNNVKGWITYPHDLYLITKDISLDN